MSYGGRENSVGRLYVVSNRLPVTVTRREGRIYFKESVGGLATGLDSFHKSHNSLWIGWPGVTSDQGAQEIRSRLMEQFSCLPVFLSKADIESHYDGYCNSTIWPLFHYFPQYIIYRDSFWDAYQRVNKIFAEALVGVATEDDMIWIHDYHLMLLPSLVRKMMPKSRIGFFLHIPFPSFEVFRLLPQRKEILEGLLGADLIGFHTYDYANHFLDSILGILGYDNSLGRIAANGREIRVDAFPMGIDYHRFSSASADAKVGKEMRLIRRKLGGRKIILSIDRLDYTKGIPQRLQAFDLFLQRNPEFRDKVSLVLVVVPSRGDVERYRALKKGIDQLVGEVNGRHGTVEWTPILYLSRFLPLQTLLSLYSIADVAMITPLRDGMNLMAKEYVATKKDGTGFLILSEMAGAAKELGEALIVNPNDLKAVAEALKEALALPDDEKIRRNREMQARLQRYDIVRWARDFIDNLSESKRLQQEIQGKILGDDETARLIAEYSSSRDRLLLLDYDGTLTGFTEKVEKATPDQEILELLRGLTNEPRNETVIISGRNKEILEEWFAGLDIGLVAEHGAWIKPAKAAWDLIDALRTDWKTEIRPLLELYVDRTPAAFVEEKTFSLVWHYRKADPELATVRARELRDYLSHLTADSDLQVLEGSKIVEIKNVGVDKGRAASTWLSRRRWDFILAIGDDVTDEDLFAALPDQAYSIKVGAGPSRAKYRVNSHQYVRLLLQQLIRG
ncbi:MAG: bifunctional alpha,alpha-trehalose-phosphate synthase (UDP-forming)/trehalose-phosphatase [Candidatus Bathyarchaeia archaeon]